VISDALSKTATATRGFVWDFAPH